MKHPIKEDADFQRKIAAARETLEYQIEYAIQAYTDELWEVLETKKLSQAELARKANVSRQFLTKIFSGENNFTLETMVKLARAVGCKLNMHLSPAEVECEWQHFYKEKPAVRASISAADWKKKPSFQKPTESDYANFALAA